MKIQRGKLLLALGGLAVLGAIGYFLWPEPAEVDLAPVTRGPLLVTVDEDGRTRIRQRYVVSAPLSGRLLRVDLRPGDKIEAGKTVLAAIDPTDPALLDQRAQLESEARVKAAEAALRRAEAEAERSRQAEELAHHASSRAAELLKSGGVSQDDFDGAEHRGRMAEEEARAAQFALVISRFELEQARAASLRARPRDGTEPDPWRFTIPSPIDGQVLRVFQESATVVTPGLRLLEVGDPADLEIEIDVLSIEAVKIRPGAKVLIERWGGPQALRARVRRVEPAAFTKISALGVEEQRVWVLADFEGPPEQRQALGDAYQLDASIVVWEGRDLLKVPAGAVFRSGGGWAAFVAVGGRARLRPIKIGQNNGLEAEVQEGLAAGEQVILHPSDRIEDRVRIEPR